MKWDFSFQQLDFYNIQPYRFSAINGWKLPESLIKSLAMSVPDHSLLTKNVLVNSSDLKDNHQKYLFSFKQGEKCYHLGVSPGKMGCTLSHLSVYQDAIDSGYETILVLEDDVLVLEDPHLLSIYIEKLDSLVGPNEWDVLYTDNIHAFEGLNFDVFRPDLPYFDTANLLAHRELSNDFVKIGGRCQTHAMIIRRSGLHKILSFIESSGIFFPNDIELAFIPGINLYNLKHNIITLLPNTISDTVTPLNE